MSRCDLPGICGLLIAGTTDVCGRCFARLVSLPLHTPRLDCERSVPTAQSPQPVGASTQSDEYRAGNTLTVTLGDLGFVFALGVVLGLAIALAVFVAGVLS